MIDFINDAVPYVGLIICTYALLSHKVCTATRIDVLNFVLFVAIYLLLALADFTGFEPVVWTVVVRCLILIVTINIIIKNHTALFGGVVFDDNRRIKVYRESSHKKDAIIREQRLTINNLIAKQSGEKQWKRQ